ncbi:MAG: TetR/AcrR family transcriptional regulator [Deltaproteobacteria bacterium]|nr:TetR/AcrR family transcriptional regulator [Deltaproteobacteria bacterium]
MRGRRAKVNVVNIPAPKSASKSPRPGRAPRATYHHGDLRNALVTAALAAIAEHGAEQFTLRDAARRAGVSPAAPYRHFADRDALLAAVAAECLNRLGAAMTEAVAAANATDPLEVFRATGLAYVRFAVEHPAHFRVMSIPAVVARTPPEVGAAMTATNDRMIASLAEAQRAGRIAAEPLADLMMTASCAVHGLACMIVDRAHGFEDIDLDRALALAEAVTGVVGTGLLPRQPHEPNRRFGGSGSGRDRAARPRAGRSIEQEPGSESFSGSDAPLRPAPPRPAIPRPAPRRRAR